MLRRSERAICLVGHEPDLSGLASRLYPDAPQLTRELFYQMGHMTMIEESRTYARVQRWLED